MKILFLTRQTIDTVFGGDTVQMYKTAESLRKLNIEVDILPSGSSINYAKYDLMHFFNIIRPADILPHLKKTNLPFVVSPIYVDYSEYEKNTALGLKKIVLSLLSKYGVEFLKVFARRIVNGERIKSWEYVFLGHKKSIQKVLKKTAMLIPNSKSEFERLSKDFSIKKKYSIAYYAVDQKDFEWKDSTIAIKDGVICVGRIEGRKNQLNLIRALNDTDIPLIIIGKPAPNHLDYFEQCKKEAGANVTFIDFMDQKDLNKYYLRSRVHVLASWFETCGLSTMEAAVMGCNIVITDKGDTREYFGEDAFYCEPNNVNSIKVAILKAYQAPLNEQLRNRIIESYTWEKTAEKTLEAYKEVLNLH